MTLPLRHSHVAVRGSIATLARAARKVVRESEDDFGRFRFFDLMVLSGEGEPQQIRFAVHDGDQMVHVLAERIEATGDLAEALLRTGVRERSQLSISTDPDDRPLRDIDEMEQSIVEAAASRRINARRVRSKLQRAGGSGKTLRPLGGRIRPYTIQPKDIGSRLRIAGRVGSKWITITITPEMVDRRVFMKVGSGLLMAKRDSQAQRNKYEASDRHDAKAVARQR
jgi:ribosomal protein S19